MDANEIRALSERIEAMRRKQGELDALQRLLANQIAALERSVRLEAAAVATLRAEISRQAQCREDRCK